MSRFACAAQILCLAMFPVSWAHADALTDFLQTREARAMSARVTANGEDPLLSLIQNIGALTAPDTENALSLTAEEPAWDLNVSSSVAMIVDPQNREVLYQKNAETKRSIASITKLMAAMVILDAQPDMNETLSVTEEDIDRLKKTGSRLTVGTKMTRREMLHIGLMASENRAIHALARHYPGGLDAFMRAMNAKARLLGMNDTVFYDPTGLDPRNQSTARDLVRLVLTAHEYPVIRSYSTADTGSVLTASGRVEKFRNSNSLVRGGDWDIELQKTGYIREAGRCMVVYANVLGRPLVIVLMNAPTVTMRVNDARSVRSWIADRNTSL